MSAKGHKPKAQRFVIIDANGNIYAGTLKLEVRGSANPSHDTRQILQRGGKYRIVRLTGDAQS